MAYRNLVNEKSLRFKYKKNYSFGRIFITEIKRFIKEIRLYV
jgi:hypothetical protein